MLRILMMILIGSLILTGAIFGYAFRGADLDEYQDLVDPRIVNMFAENMLVIEATGNPNDLSREIFGIMAGAHIDDMMPANLTMPALRVRWESPYDLSTSDWVGHYAMPVPARMVEVPGFDEEPRFEVKLETWEYGQVAEILHVGPYEQEQNTIDRLEAFIAEQGYQIVGEREEEYLRGPSVWPPSKQKYTIIRYRVQER